ILILLGCVSAKAQQAIGTNYTGGVSLGGVTLVSSQISGTQANFAGIVITNSWNASGATNLNATNLAAGTIPFARAGGLTNHSDVTITSLQPGDVLAWSGTAWTNGPPSGGSGGGNNATNSGPIVLSISGTNVAVLASTPVGCTTNALLPYTLTLTTNVLIQHPTGMLDGQRIAISFAQDGTGSRLAAFDTKFSFGTDITGITLSTTASITDVATFIYNSTADKWRCVGFTRGY